MARPRRDGEVVFQWFTARWRRLALRQLALSKGTLMCDEVDAAVDAYLKAVGVPLGDDTGDEQ